MSTTKIRIYHNLYTYYSNHSYIKSPNYTTYITTPHYTTYY